MFLDKKIKATDTKKSKIDAAAYFAWYLEGVIHINNNFRPNHNSCQRGCGGLLEGGFVEGGEAVGEQLSEMGEVLEGRVINKCDFPRKGEIFTQKIKNK